MKRKIQAFILVIALLLTLLPQTVQAANGAEPVLTEGAVEYDAVFLSDLHNGVGGYPGLKQMMEELGKEALNPKVLSHGGDYVEDSLGGQVDWKTQVYDVISGTEKAAFPDAKQGYAMGNHDWESGTFGGRTDKEAAFEEVFGFPRCGMAYADSEMEIYYIGAQGETGSGGGGESFIQADIDAFDQYLASRVGSGKVIFLQTHWPAHSSYNFRQRIVANSDKLIDVMNKYSDQMDLVWIWGHNHYEDVMRFEIKQPGDEILYSASTSSKWGDPRSPKYKTIQFIYANAGCMNDMWYLQDGHKDVDASDNYRGTSACLSVAVEADSITFTYNRITPENGEWVFSHNADITIHDTLFEHPATVTIDRKGVGDTPGLDYTALDSAIKAAESVNRSDYTDASVAALEKALEAAYAARNDGDQTAVDDAAAALEDALESLEPRPCEHDYRAVVTEPTCLQPGFTTYTCAKCGDSYVGNEVAALGHDYQSSVTAPTCTEAGYTTYTCSRCGDSYTGNPVEAKGHSFIQQVGKAYLARAATYESPAVYYYSCAECGAIDKTRTFLYGDPLVIPEEPEAVSSSWIWNCSESLPSALLRIVWSDGHLSTFDASVRLQSETDRETTYYAFAEVSGKTYESVKTVAKAYHVTVKNGSFVSEQKDSFSYGEEITVCAASAPSGCAFSGWYSGDVLISTSETYSCRVTDDLDLEAKFAKEKVDPQPVVNASSTSRTYIAETGKYKTSLQLSWSLPAGYQLVEAGLYRAYTQQPMTADDVVKSGTLSKSTLKNASGKYTLNVTMGSGKKDYDLCYVGYVICRDASGQTKTVYTPVGCNQRI